MSTITDSPAELPSPAAGWLTAAEATGRLGVKRETLYAYVSRGLIRSERVPGARTSRFLRSDVERMAARDPVRRGAGRLDVVIDSALTRLEPAGRLYFRGHDVVSLAREETYERTANLLWAGKLGGPPSWAAPEVAARVGSRAQRALPREAGVTDRLHVIAAAVRAVDPLRDDRSRAAVVEHARQLVATLVDALPAQQDHEPLDASIAARLWIKLSPQPPTRARVDAARRRPRAARRPRAGGVHARGAGRGVDVGRPVPGRARRDVGRRRSAARRGVPCGPGPAGGAAGGIPADTAIAERLRQANTVPGTGHPVYEGPDPRCVALLAAIQRLRPPKDLRAAMAAILSYTDRRGTHPNVDFALGSFTEEAEMVPDAGEAIYLVARSAGWIAHALEEYEHRLRFRPRAVYTGPAPSD